MCKIPKVDTPEAEYESCWKEILEDEDGNIDKAQLLKELSDFSFILHQLPSVYMAVSGGYLSKANYHAETVLAKFEDLIEKEREEAIKDAIEYEEVVPREKVDTLYDAIAHGDEKHRAWLKEAIEEHFAAP